MADNKFSFSWDPDKGISVPEPQEQEAPMRVGEPVFDADVTLKQEDLLEYENLNRIRDYMVRRKGVQYNDKDAEEVVDDFVSHMRYFNTNLVSTAGEVRFITNASEEDKVSANSAYGLYDRLGSVFVNDGAFGAVEGVGEYIAAAATDPSNYVGLLTGGIAKGTALGVTAGSRQLIKQAAQEAAQRAIQSGATQQAAKQAGDAAAKSVAARLATRGVTGKAADRVVGRVAKQESDLFLYGAGEAAKRSVTDPLKEQAARRALYGTVALDGTFAALNDYQIQNVMLDVGAQEEYSRTQTAFSSLLGTVGGGFQLAGRQAKGASGLTNAADRVQAATTRAEQESIVSMALNNTQAEEAGKQIKKTVDSWEAKYTRGSNMFDPNVTPADLIQDIILGEYNRGGLVKIFKDNGMKMSRNMTVSDVMTNVARQLPESTLKEINDTLQKRIGVTLGETTEIGTPLGDLLAKDIRQSAKTLNVMSQVRKTLDAGVVHGSNVIDSITKRGDVDAAINEEKIKQGSMKPVQYGQSVWRRLLVSSPATSAINLVGFSQFTLGSSLADLFSSSTLAMYGVARGGEKGAEALRMAKVFKDIQAQKMRNFADPFTTHDAYMAILKANPDVDKVLRESFSGGVERSGKRFNIDPDAKWFKRTETVTEAANMLTGVRIQDTFTKSQMFITELDKQLRLTKNKTLDDVLQSGTIDEIDDAVLGPTMDSTLKSVFSKDYTTDDQMLSNIAKFVETVSNTPVLGTVLPFGRFMNNVVATVYQWTPLGLASVASNLWKGDKMTSLEAFSRAAVGTSALVSAIHFDKERRQKGLAYNEIDVGGTIVDAKNTFPFSLFLIGGRIGGLMSEGQTVPKELIVELGSQVGVGQFASDVQFGNDFINTIDTFLNMDEGDRVPSLNGLIKAGGNITAGFMRPLDPVNKLVGYIDNTDAARDLRQAESGMQTFTQASTRYVDNIFERLVGKADAVTGEELRVATREGDLYDPNPMARIFGITIRPARTSTEQAYSMANMAEWTASERTKMPEYDRIFNQTVAPLLERRMEGLLRDKRYVEGNSDVRKAMLKSELTAARKQVRDFMRDNSFDPETRIAALRRQANMNGNKELRREALDAMKSRFNFAGSVDDMGYKELKWFMDHVDLLEDYYKAD